MNLPSNFYHYAFVGGPHTGKSQSLKVVYHELLTNFTHPTDIRVFYCAESATRILTDRPDRDNTTLSFQFEVIAGQLEAIEKAIDFAGANPKVVTLLLSDRALLDGLIFLPKEAHSYINWGEFTSLYTRLFIFDFHPIFLKDSAAPNSNAVRKENSENELARLSDRTFEVYAESGLIPRERITIIPCFDTLQQKTAYVTEVVMSTLLSEEIKV